MVEAARLSCWGSSGLGLVDYGQEDPGARHSSSESKDVRPSPPPPPPIRPGGRADTELVGYHANSPPVSSLVRTLWSNRHTARASLFSRLPAIRTVILVTSGLVWHNVIPNKQKHCLVTTQVRTHRERQCDPDIVL